MSTELYLKALDSPKLDRSDFILLTVDFLKEKIGDKEAALIREIQQDYVNYDYREALNKINKLIQDKKYEEHFPSDLVQLMLNKQKPLKNMDKPLEDQSRRYFETKYAQQIWLGQEKKDMPALTKLSAMYKEQNPELGKRTPGEVKDLDDAAKVIREMREFGEKTQSVLDKENQMRKPPDSISKLKDRSPTKRTGKEQDSKDTRSNIPLYSMNPGVMLASSPMPMDERLPKPAENRITDLFTIVPLKDDKKGYSASRPEVPFVNSISGTVYTLAAVLSNYIEKNKDDTTLQADVNSIVRSYISFACMNGYHSLAEMVDVLRDPEVQKVFSDNSIPLDTNFISEKGFDETMRLATNYARTVALQQATQAEMLKTGASRLKHVPEEEQHRPQQLAYGSNSSRHEMYPMTLAAHGLPKNKVTGPRVAKTLRKIAAKDPIAALYTLNKFQEYAKGKHFTMNEINELKKELTKIKDKKLQEIKEREAEIKSTPKR